MGLTPIMVNKADTGKSFDQRRPWGSALSAGAAPRTPSKTPTSAGMVQSDPSRSALSSFFSCATQDTDLLLSSELDLVLSAELMEASGLCYQDTGATELLPSDPGKDSSSESVIESSSEPFCDSSRSALPSFLGREVVPSCRRQHASESFCGIGNDRGYSG
ncbi:MAG: hypothetical protein FRX49_04879 [Trebouxia sp. A1-2]|nr:MAG: hypothetical protein FRX49_04879 [Trebouxia sp. A1-2]